MTPTTRDAFIVTALDRATGMLKNLAYRCGIDDWQDLRQAAAIELLAYWLRIESARDPQAYAHTVIRTAALQYIRTCDHLVSLDEPIHEESDTPLHELLEPPTDCPTDLALQDTKAAIVHQALRKLPLEVQLYLREVYALNGYNPVLPCMQDGTYRKPNYHRSRQALSKMAYRHLRADSELAAALEVW
ncbi:MAG TPA: hypothetical protein VFA10_11475 [Ktedonobacteraceae bacterium]|nr:hypothetical protein [Ktedonobacteraceae bacterium]